MKEIYVQLVVVLLLKACQALSPDMMIGNLLLIHIRHFGRYRSFLRFLEDKISG